MLLEHAQGWHKSRDKFLKVECESEMAKMSFCMPKTDFWSLGGPLEMLGGPSARRSKSRPGLERAADFQDQPRRSAEDLKHAADRLPYLGGPLKPSVRKFQIYKWL